ncbi:MAG TPA: hypothetical protein VE643_09350 [Nitrososphaeraceae archaeon]|nr:hypothetical protein [Nitrososphaeraceae archaeon]
MCWDSKDPKSRVTFSLYPIDGGTSILGVVVLAIRLPLRDRNNGNAANLKSKVR